MPRTDVTVLTEDGACAATLHTPSRRGSWPTVILYPDAGGVRETFDAMADRLAGLNYAVLPPARVSRFRGVGSCSCVVG
jgi:carboxymethylenebutenolidase